MKKELLNYLACPACKNEFKLTVHETEGNEITKGTLTCKKCKAQYPISGGVPRILPKLSAVEKKTALAFGYEWKNFREHYGYYESQFLSWIEPIKPSFFKGKVVMDAGCGMGRNLYYAAKYGAKCAIGIDLSDSVDVAHRLTKEFPNVHIVQGDIYNLPFKESFDYIFSIGVLHHLPNPRKGFESLLTVLKKKGVISIWVYGKEGNFLIRTVGSFVRINITSKMPHKLLKILCVPLAAILHILTKYLYKPLNLTWAPYGKYFIALADFDFRNKLSIIFDHLVPPIAFYLSKQETKAWLAENNLSKIVVSRRYDNSWRGAGTK